MSRDFAKQQTKIADKMMLNREDINNSIKDSLLELASLDLRLEEQLDMNISYQNELKNIQDYLSKQKEDNSKLLEGLMSVLTTEN